jgi:hypothetical protein
MSNTQDIYVIDVNANCDLDRTSEFAAGAEAYGMDYRTLINRITQLAVERHKNKNARRLYVTHGR